MAPVMPLPTALAEIAPEYWLFGAAGVLSLAAFAALILAPALGSYGRTWEKVAASVVSVFLLLALITLGVAAGVAIVYFWDDITSLL
jgi:hypothetical protein